MKTHPSQGEALGAWALWGAVTLAVLVTYSRLDATELYNVSEEGLAGGLGRAVVLLNFPIALRRGRARSRRRRGAAVEMVAGRGPGDRAAARVVPFTVDQDDLDVRWVNAIPALGVALALVADDRGRPCARARRSRLAVLETR